MKMTFNRQRTPTRVRSYRGAVTAEAPAGLWLLIIGIALPLIAYATQTYRASLYYFGVRDACYQAAKAPTFGQALIIARDTLRRDSATWTGVSIVSDSTRIVVRNIQTGAETESAGPLASVNTNQFMYFLRTRSTGRIDPFISFGPSGFLGLAIPGLSAPFNLDFHFQVYVEVPNGLTE